MLCIHGNSLNIADLLDVYIYATFIVVYMCIIHSNKSEEKVVLVSNILYIIIYYTCNPLK